MKKIAILGEGAWGTAMATVLSQNGHEVRLWCHDAKNAHTIATAHTNPTFLPGIELSPLIIPVTDFKDAFAGVDYAVMAIPVAYIRQTVEIGQSFVPKNVPWVIGSKGIEQGTGMLPAQIMEEVLGTLFYAIVGGPSFANEVAQKQITAVMIGSQSSKLVTDFQSLFQNDYFLVQESDDPIGMQVAGALKNVIALATGLVHGAGYGYNTRGWILMKGFDAMKALIKYYGGKQETADSLAGIGDLCMTAMAETSRNYSYGKKFGAALITKQEEYAGGIVEGLNTLKTIAAFSYEENALFKGLFQVFYEGKNIQQFLNEQK